MGENRVMSLLSQGSPTMSLPSKVAIVTGAGSGVGKAAALALLLPSIAIEDKF